MALMLMPQSDRAPCSREGAGGCLIGLISAPYVDGADPGAAGGQRWIGPRKRPETSGRTGDADRGPEFRQMDRLDRRALCGEWVVGECDVTLPVSVTVRVSVDALPAASRAVTVRTFDPD